MQRSRRCVADEETKKLFRDLTTAEEHHKASLVNLYKTFAGKGTRTGFPRIDYHRRSNRRYHGRRNAPQRGPEMGKGQKPDAIFELSMALETNSYDLYIKMSRQMKDEKSRQVFDQLSKEEKKHLESLAGFFEKKFNRQSNGAQLKSLKLDIFSCK